MANKPPADKAHPTLQRGKACLRCRKRKMKCDGVKPACQQCTRAKKPDACEYDDGKGKTRTQIMRETISRLERRVRELEDPEYISPAVTLYDPHGHSRSGSSASSTGSPDSSFLSVSHSPFPSGSPTSPASAWIQNVPSPSPSPFITEVYYEEPQSHVHVSLELSTLLLDIFAPYQQQCGLGLNVQRLRENLHRPFSEQPHPVLMNSIYLWACFVSRPGPICQHEDLYLRQVLENLPDALKSTDKILDVIQASCLLSMYYLANGRMCEGGYHVSAAAALAVQAGLGRDVFQHDLWLPTCHFEGFDLKPVKSSIQEGARILTFWQIFSLDRCWSVFLQRPPIISDGPDVRNVITSPWPQELRDYETGLVNRGSSIPTVRAFLNGDVSSGGFSATTLRAKASALLAQADVVSGLAGMKQNGRFSDEVANLDQTICLFISMLVPISQLNRVIAEERQSLILAHTLANCAMIHLHRAPAHDDSSSFEKCSHAARACVTVIKHIDNQDSPFLDPVLAPCWSIVADHLVVELDTLETAWPTMCTSEVRDELSTILRVMTIFSTRYPVITPALNKLQKRLLI
ncbi:hypothetical protein P691DRAFT_784501 [Macrolepiota fuliginosa MF-IS2]|uniref:Zn(2)-C6 fungal-type domain-containing protein n=1 Tax=Macrolepiota fuliginosa MF-IS2 TaxID=1400762 RepID=A0A9P5XJ12_9AGAR|nr:hypothetical protein P691DRAFT_784501 [Macrolepiota fuliginosa MF-IS2]